MAKHRRHGEGSVFTRELRGKTVYIAQAAGGKLQRSGPTAAKALANLKKAMLSAGNLASAKTTDTLRTFLSDWLESMRGELREKTVQDYQSVQTKHIFPHVGAVQLGAVTPAHIRTCLAKVATQSKSLQRKVYDLLNAPLERAVRDELIAKNPCWKVDAPTVQKSKVSGIEDADLSEIMKKIEGDRLEALWLLLLAGGPRRGEALAIDREKDVRLWKEGREWHGELTIRRSLQRVAGRLVFVVPKTPAGFRTFSLPAMIVSALRKHLEQIESEKKKAGSGWCDEWEGVRLLFATKGGTPLEPRNVLRRWKQLSGYNVHATRHTAASMMLRDGVDPKTAQHVLGHARASVLLDTYGHMMAGRTGVAAASQDAALRKIKGKK